MDKKRTQRILGILIIFALVIILFPLLFGKNEAPPQVASVTAAPPFPDPQQCPPATTAAESNNNIQPVNSVEPMTEKTEPVIQSPIAANISEATATIDDQQSSPVVSPAIALDMNGDKSTQAVQAFNTAREQPEIAEPVKAKSVQQAVIPVVNQKAIKSITLTKTKKQLNARVKSSLAANHESLVKLSSKAWAIQIGSFKSKANAKTLANRLRAAGFKAFTRDIRSPSGMQQTRVYIGPEIKQASAIQLNADLQQAMNIQGIIIPYEALAL
jgi:cell division septation protein DedD